MARSLDDAGWFKDSDRRIHMVGPAVPAENDVESMLNPAGTAGPDAGFPATRLFHHRDTEFTEMEMRVEQLGVAH